MTPTTRATRAATERRRRDEHQGEAVDVADDRVRLVEVGCGTEGIAGTTRTTSSAPRRAHRSAEPRRGALVRVDSWIHKTTCLRPWRRLARPPRATPVETSRSDAAAATWTYLRNQRGCARTALRLGAQGAQSLCCTDSRSRARSHRAPAFTRNRQPALQRVAAQLSGSAALQSVAFLPLAPLHTRSHELPRRPPRRNLHVDARVRRRRRARARPRRVAALARRRRRARRAPARPESRSRTTRRVAAKTNGTARRGETTAGDDARPRRRRATAGTRGRVAAKTRRRRGGPDGPRENGGDSLDRPPGERATTPSAGRTGETLSRIGRRHRIGSAASSAPRENGARARTRTRRGTRRRGASSSSASARNRGERASPPRTSRAATRAVPNCAVPSRCLRSGRAPEQLSKTLCESGLASAWLPHRRRLAPPVHGRGGRRRRDARAAAAARLPRGRRVPPRGLPAHAVARRRRRPLRRHLEFPAARRRPRVRTSRRRSSRGGGPRRRRGGATRIFRGPTERTKIDGHRRSRDELTRS